MAESAATAHGKPVVIILTALLASAAMACDPLPVLHGCVLVGLVLLASVQLERELAVALALKQIHLSTTVMDLVGPIAALHVIYLARWARYSTALELLGVVLVSLFMLVLVAALTTDVKIHGWRQGLRDLALSLVLPTLAGAALGSAAIVQAWHTGRPETGAVRLALVLAAAWTGSGVMGALATSPVAGALGCVGGALVVLLGGSLALHQGAPGPAAALGVAVGLGTWAGRLALARLKAWSGLSRWRAPLLEHLRFFQPLCDSLYAGGAMDYVGPLLLALPAAAAVCALVLPR